MYKKLYLTGIFFALMGFSNGASADIISEFHPGFYGKFEAGLGHMDIGSGLKDWSNYIYHHYSLAHAQIMSEQTWALRGALGYRFSPYVEMEAGYTYYPSNHYKANGSLPGGGTRFMDMTVKGNAMDLVAKISFPLSGFAPELGDLAPYVKLGAAYVHNNLSGHYGGANNPGPEPGPGPVISSINESHSSVRPLYGFGVAYHYSERLMFDCSWTFISGKNKIGFASTPNPRDLPLSNTDRSTASSSFLSFGVVYRWPLDR